MMPSSTHLVLMPSYNTGGRLEPTVKEALQHWQPVWVVIDGSTDGSAAAITAWAQSENGRSNRGSSNSAGVRSANTIRSSSDSADDTEVVPPDSADDTEVVRPIGAKGNQPHLRVIVRAHNGGKGAAVLTGAEAALAAGFTHALVMDADGQHPAASIAEFMAASRAMPNALVLGQPVFGPEAPAIRRQGRKLSVGLVRWEILGSGIADPLFGFRVYPLAELANVLRGTRGARRYDFDPEVAVRLFWAGIPTVQIPAPCRYLMPSEGGVSHFHYGRDNLRMVWLHTRLICELWFRRWPAVRRLRRQNQRRSTL